MMKLEKPVSEFHKLYGSVMGKMERWKYAI
jgi:hypothetical protein